MKYAYLGPGPQPRPHSCMAVMYGPERGRRQVPRRRESRAAGHRQTRVVGDTAICEDTSTETPEFKHQVRPDIPKVLVEARSDANDAGPSDEKVGMERVTLRG